MSKLLLALMLSLSIAAVGAPAKKETVTAKTVEVKGKKQPAKKAEKKEEVKKPFDPNRKVPTLKKKYRKDDK